MNFSNQHSKPYINFKAWSRKGYAIFASLRIQVRIAFLGIYMCMLDCLSCVNDYMAINYVNLFGDIGKHILYVQAKRDLNNGMSLIYLYP